MMIDIFSITNKVPFFELMSYEPYLDIKCGHDTVTVNEDGVKNHYTIISIFARGVLTNGGGFSHREITGININRPSLDINIEITHDIQGYWYTTVCVNEYVCGTMTIKDNTPLYDISRIITFLHMAELYDALKCDFHCHDLISTKALYDIVTYEPYSHLYGDYWFVFKNLGEFSDSEDFKQELLHKVLYVLTMISLDTYYGSFLCHAICYSAPMLLCHFATNKFTRNIISHEYQPIVDRYYSTDGLMKRISDEL